MTPPFVPGIELARDFYFAVVRPLLSEEYPRLEYAAALLGPGSDVARFDTERSTDHDWGPRLQVFLLDGDAGRQARPVTATLERRLPEAFRGYPVRFPLTSEPDGTARHRVEVTGLGTWAAERLGFDPRRAITLLDWLATPTQRLAEFTTGEIFHDAPGELTRARENAAWYPEDVWRYILACQWQRINQEEPFPGRCAEAGDALGSRVVAARLARDLMRLCLLMRRRYPPYSKWLGTAFSRHAGDAELTASLTAAICADDHQARERHLAEVLTGVAAMHNQLRLTPPLDTSTRGFYGRPFQVLGAARFTRALLETVADPRIKGLPLAGAVDQFTDSTDAAGNLGFLRSCAAAAIGVAFQP